MERKNNTRYFALLLIIVIGGVFVTLQNTKNNPKKEGVSSLVITEIPKAAETQTNETIKKFTLIAKQWDFTPSEVRVKQGDKVRLTIKSIDVSHGFFLPDFKINATLIPQKEAVVEFIADKQGTFIFSCNIACGSGHNGMRGTLIVE